MTRKKRKRRSVWQSIWSVRHHPRTDQFGCQTPPDRRSPSLTQGPILLPRNWMSNLKCRHSERLSSALPKPARILTNSSCPTFLLRESRCKAC
jgi:UDP:flavonoid glycosyltransferase YjiC (YdhE family)